MITFEIPVLTPMLNVYVRWHWAKQRKHTEELAWLVKAATMDCRPDKPIKKCRIRIVRRSKGKRLHDWDGLLGGMKGLLDAMTATHKYGVGLIEDDNTACIVEMPEIIVETCLRGESERTAVVIFDVDGGE